MVLSTSLPSPIPSSTPTKHSSSSCGSKKTRKGSFGQSAKTTSATEVGDFQGGYFVMPSPSPSSPSKFTTQSNKSSHSSSYDKKNKRFETPQRDVGISPPKNTYDHTSSSAKSEATPTKKNSSRKANASPKTCSASPSTSPSSSYIQQAVGHTLNTTTPINNITHSSISSKLNDASSSSSRWAGPAFSNAPPPSSLPLPSFPPLAPSPSPSTAQSAIPPSVTQYPQHHYHIQSIPPPPVSYSLDHQDPSSLSAYPFVNMLPSLDNAHHQPTSYLHHPHDESSWLSSLSMHHHHLPSHSVMMSSSHHHQHDEKVPPASSSYPYAPIPSASPVVSLADLSTDLRRMLNISSSSPTPSSATMMSDHSLLGSRLIPVHSS